MRFHPDQDSFLASRLFFPGPLVSTAWLGAGAGASPASAADVQLRPRGAKIASVPRLAPASNGVR